MLREFKCDTVEDGKRSEASMKSFSIKASISEMIHQGKEEGR